MGEKVHQSLRDEGQHRQAKTQESPLHQRDLGKIPIQGHQQQRHQRRGHDKPEPTQHQPPSPGAGVPQEHGHLGGVGARDQVDRAQ